MVSPYPGSIVGSFFVMWIPTNSTHMVIVPNKEGHLFLGSERGEQKGLPGKYSLGHLISFTLYPST